MHNSASSLRDHSFARAPLQTGLKDVASMIIIE